MTTYHYAKENIECLTPQDIKYVIKKDNCPNVPETRENGIHVKKSIEKNAQQRLKVHALSQKNESELAKKLTEMP